MPNDIDNDLHNEALADARRTRDLGLQAERDEQRTATEQERYETTQQQYAEGLRREDTRNRITDERYENEFALREELHDRQIQGYDDTREDRLRTLETNTAIADYYRNSAGLTGEALEEARAELLGNPKIDYRKMSCYAQFSVGSWPSRPYRS